MSLVAVTPPLDPPAGEAPPTPPAARRASHRMVREILEIGVIALVLYLAVSGLLQTVRVEGESMLPTLRTQDLLLASRISYHLHDPERGDIVILKPPPPELPDRDFIKRIIGIPGDVLAIDSGQHPAVIRIRPGGSGPAAVLREPYLGERWEQASPCCDAGGHATTTSPTDLTIPPDRFFVMGDNRNSSKDSRSFGLVPKGDISAKAVLRIWPLGTLGGLGPGPTLAPAAVMVLPVRLLLRAVRRRRARAQGPVGNLGDSGYTRGRVSGRGQPLESRGGRTGAPSIGAHRRRAIEPGDPRDCRGRRDRADPLPDHLESRPDRAGRGREHGAHAADP